MGRWQLLSPWSIGLSVAEMCVQACGKCFISGSYIYLWLRLSSQYHSYNTVLWKRRLSETFICTYSVSTKTFSGSLPRWHPSLQNGTGRNPTTFPNVCSLNWLFATQCIKRKLKFPDLQRLTTHLPILINTTYHKSILFQRTPLSLILLQE